MWALSSRYAIPYYRDNIATADLMKLAHVGKKMLYEAIKVAYIQENAEFFDAAFGLYGPLIPAVMRDMEMPEYCSRCGAMMPHIGTCKRDCRANAGQP